MKNAINLFTIKLRRAFVAILLCAMACAPFNTLAEQESVQVQAAFAQQQKLVAANGEANDLLGCSVAIDGNTAIVGAHKDRFTLTGVVWTQQQKLTACDSTSNDIFGDSAALQ